MLVTSSNHRRVGGAIPATINTVCDDFNSWVYTAIISFVHKLFPRIFVKIQIYAYRKLNVNECFQKNSGGREPFYNNDYQ